MCARDKESGREREAGRGTDEHREHTAASTHQYKTPDRHRGFEGSIAIVVIVIVIVICRGGG